MLNPLKPKPRTFGLSGEPEATQSAAAPAPVASPFSATAAAPAPVTAAPAPQPQAQQVRTAPMPALSGATPKAAMSVAPPAAPTAQLETTPAKSVPLTVAEPAPPAAAISDVAGMRPNEVWVLPKGQVVDYSGKLEDDVDQSFRKEWGRGAEEGEKKRYRDMLASGGLDLEQWRRDLDAQQAGQDHNLATDPLNDEMFVRRLFRDAIGREPDAQDMAHWGNRLRQGQDRRGLAAGMRDWARTMGKDLTEEQIEKLIGQGDPFKAELKNDDIEREIARDFKAEIGRDANPYELAKYAELVRSGQVKRETTDMTKPEDIAKTFYGELFGADYTPTAQDMQMVTTAVQNAAANGQDPNFVLEQMAAQRMLGEDWRQRGRQANPAQVRAAIQNLRTQNTKSPLLDMLRARKRDNFNKGGRVKAPRAAVMGLSEGGRVRMKDVIDGKKTPSKESDPKVRTLTGQAGTRGRKEDEEEAQHLADGGRISRDLANSILNEQGYFNNPDGVNSTNADWNTTLANWDSLSDADRFAFLRTIGGGKSYSMKGSDEDTAAFRAKFGDSPWDDKASGRSVGEYGQQYLTGYGDLPTQFEAGIDEYGLDPSRVLRMEDGRWVIESNNVKGDWKASAQDVQSRGRQRRLRQGMTPLLVAGVAGALEVGALAGGAGEAGGYSVDLGAGGNGVLQGGGTPTGWAPTGAETAAGTGVSGGSGVAAEVAVPGDLPINTGPPGGGVGTPLVETPAITSPNGGSFTDRLLSWAQKNPQQAARLGLSVGSLLSGGSDAPGSGNTPQYTPGAGQTYTPGTRAGGYTMPTYTAPAPYKAPPQQQRKPRGYAGGGRVAAMGLNPEYANIPPEVLAQLQATPEGQQLLDQIINGGDMQAGPLEVDASGNPVGGNPIGRGADVSATRPVADPAAAANPLARTGNVSATRTGAREPVTIDNGTGAVVGDAPAPAGGAAPVVYGGMGSSSISRNTSATTASDDPIAMILGVGQEQLNRYRRFDPLERQVIDEAGKAGGTVSQEEQAALAGEDVAGQFDRQRAMVRRRVGVDPARAAALSLGLDVAEGGSKAYAMNSARRAERDSGFGKRMAALGLGDAALKTGVGALSGATSALLNKEQMQTSRDNAAQAAGASSAAVAARMHEAEMGRQDRRYEYDTSMDRRTYEDDRNFGRSVYADDRNFGRRTYESDRGFGRNVYADDRDFDFGVWRANTGIDRADDDRDYTRGRQRASDIGSGVRTAFDIWNNGGSQAWNSFWGSKDGGRVSKEVVAKYGISMDDGGTVPGSPHPNPNVDTVPAMLRPGEVVVNVEGTQFLDKVAPGLLDKANERGRAIRKMRSSRAATRGLEV
jgi:hypothetical protein